MFGPLISPCELNATLSSTYQQAPPCIVDCRFNLLDPDRGQRQYHQSHIPGAHYLHLNHDLSAKTQSNQTGRHPLPEKGDFTQLLRALGINKNTQIVCYDDAKGAFAARAWWMFRWAGLIQVAVLEGGWSGWIHEGLPISEIVPEGKKSQFTPVYEDQRLIQAREILDRRESLLLLDARTQDRFSGQNETIDPIGGHIPGAVCLPFLGNLQENDQFLSPSALKNRFEKYSTSLEAVCYCGSGVTACHNILAFAVAQLSEPRLYVGSWSEWIQDRNRPITT